MANTQSKYPGTAWIEGPYQYVHTWVWEAGLPPICYIMLNPPTADATTNDPTIRSCIRLAQRNGYGRMEVVNLFALRTPSPSELPHAFDPVGPWKDSHLLAACSDTYDAGGTVVAAWGAEPFAQDRAVRVLNMLAVHGIPVYCFGYTKNGSPRHPLHLPNLAQLQRYHRAFATYLRIGRGRK